MKPLPRIAQLSRRRPQILRNQFRVSGGRAGFVELRKGSRVSFSGGSQGATGRVNGVLAPVGVLSRVEGSRWRFGAWWGICGPPRGLVGTFAGGFGHLELQKEGKKCLRSSGENATSFARATA